MPCYIWKTTSHLKTEAYSCPGLISIDICQIFVLDIYFLVIVKRKRFIFHYSEKLKNWNFRET